MGINNKIGVSEAVSVLLIVPLAHLLVTLPEVILKNQGSSSIVNTVYVTLIILFVIWLLNLFFKNFKDMDILDISSYLLGKGFKFIIGIIFITYFLIVASLIFRSIGENLKAVYFPSTPMPYILFFILIPIGFVNKYNFKTVIKCNLLVLPIILISLFILSLLSVPDFTLERIFPMFGYGINNTFLSGISNIFMFSNISLLFFIMPLLKDSSKFNKISYISIIASGLLFILTISSILLMLPIEISSASNSPIYLQARTVTLGNFIQRVDAFFVLTWIITILSYLSIVVAFANNIFKKITNIQDKSSISFSIIAILFALTLMYTDAMQIRKMDILIYKYGSLILVFGASFLILILGNNKKKIKGDIQN